MTSLETTIDNRIILRNFWPNTPNDYLPKFESDVSKAFLVDLIQLVIGDADIKVMITSVNERRKTGIGRVGYLVMKKPLALLTSSKGERISSEYGHKAITGPMLDCVNIWYSGENKRPPLDENWDSFLSYEVETFGGRNIYLPLWVTRLAPSVEGAVKKIEDLVHARNNTETRYKGFCAVISNPEPLRMEFIRLLRKKVDVDIFGRIGQEIENKNRVLTKYNFNVCFENDEYPGYVTEKPFEAWMSGCIPVWRGLDPLQYLNSNAIIDVSKSNFEAAIDYIVDLSKNKNEVLRIRNQPILQKPFDINSLIGKLQSQIFYTSKRVKDKEKFSDF